MAALTVSPASALWNQRFALASGREKITALHTAIGHQGDLSLFQFAQFIAFTLEYRPDLILELGRGHGNSTCAFTQAANLLGAEHCKVISLCRTPSWESHRPPSIAAVVSDEWFRPLSTCSGDILDFDYAALLSGARRVLVFWDAHGYDIADCVLGEILPLLANREHVVIMHDMSDIRYSKPHHREYGERFLWRGMDKSSRCSILLGHLLSGVEQAVSIVDFASRNNIVVHSADESLHVELDEQKCSELTKLLGPELFSQHAHWAWLSCNEIEGRPTFPRRRPRA